MKSEVKQKWVDALNSGEFEQGTGVLRRDNDTYCCLGVLCELYRRETSNGEWILDEDNNRFRFVSGGGKHYNSDSVSFLTADVVSWAGLNTDIPSAGGELLHGRNDSGATFSEIASLIEDNL